MLPLVSQLLVLHCRQNMSDLMLGRAADVAD